MKTIALRTGSPVLTGAFAALAAVLVGSASPAAAQDLREIEVVGATPMPGTGIAHDRVPASVQTLEAGDFDILVPRNLTDLMEQRLTGVSVKDVQNSPYQQNVDYRGYTLSPLLGEAQGIAVFLDGVRVNEGFGDTMQWDLVPEAAISRVDLVGGNPVFGLNALGGSLAITTKNGHDWQGNEAEAIFGSHGRIGGSAEMGLRRNDTGFYAALEVSEDDGWRDHSPSEIRRLFGNVRHRLDQGEVGASLLHAATEITGNGPTPEDLLEARRESVFTWPDITDNSVTMGTVRGRYDVRDNLSLSGLLYTRQLERDTINGDEFDAEFEDIGSTNYLVVEDDDTGGRVFLFDENGDPIRLPAGAEEPDFVGARNLTFTETDSLGLSLQADLDRERHLLSLGVAHDRSETDYRGHTLVGALDGDSRGVPAFQIDGKTVTVGGQCDSRPDGDGKCGTDNANLDPSDADPLEVTTANESWGLYISSTFRLSERLDLTFAGRYNRTEIELDLHDGEGEMTHEYVRFNPAIGLVRRVSPDLTLYGGYREANRAPTAAELACADPEEPCRLPNAFLADPTLEQVVARTLEFGARGTRGTSAMEMAWDVSLYGSENRDDLIFIGGVESDVPGLGYFDNFGKTRRLGIDAALTGRRGRLDWFANYSFLRATFETGGKLPGANHPNADDDGNIEVASGDRIPGLPEHALKLGVGFQPAERLRFGLNSVSRSGVHLRGDESNQLARTRSYTVVNLTGEYRRGPLTIFGRIENLLDAGYESFGILGECEEETDGCDGEVPITGHGLEDDRHHTNRFLSPGAPRGIFLGARYSF